MAFQWMEGSAALLAGFVGEILEGTRRELDTDPLHLGARKHSFYEVTDDIVEFAEALAENGDATFKLYPFDENQEYGMTGIQEQHANMLLPKCKKFAELRYQLCPKQMKDDKFWHVYFILLSNVQRKLARKYENNLRSRPKIGLDFKACDIICRDPTSLVDLSSPIKDTSRSTESLSQQLARWEQEDEDEVKKNVPIVNLIGTKVFKAIGAAGNSTPNKSNLFDRFNVSTTEVERMRAQRQNAQQKSAATAEVVKRPNEVNVSKMADSTVKKEEKTTKKESFFGGMSSKLKAKLQGESKTGKIDVTTVNVSSTEGEKANTTEIPQVDSIITSALSSQNIVNNLIADSDNVTDICNNADDNGDEEELP